MILRSGPQYGGFAFASVGVLSDIEDRADLSTTGKYVMEMDAVKVLEVPQENIAKADANWPVSRVSVAT
jgi:hypothetical protein